MLFTIYMTWYALFYIRWRTNYLKVQNYAESKQLKKFFIKEATAKMEALVKERDEYRAEK